MSDGITDSTGTCGHSCRCRHCKPHCKSCHPRATGKKKRANNKLTWHQKQNLKLKIRIRHLEAVLKQIANWDNLRFKVFIRDNTGITGNETYEECWKRRGFK